MVDACALPIQIGPFIAYFFPFMTIMTMTRLISISSIPVWTGIHSVASHRRNTFEKPFNKVVSCLFITLFQSPPSLLLALPLTSLCYVYVVIIKVVLLPVKLRPVCRRDIKPPIKLFFLHSFGLVGCVHQSLSWMTVRVFISFVLPAGQVVLFTAYTHVSVGKVEK